MFAFALAIFTGAFLLFQVQPLIGKYILPWFGGAPGVWTTCMLFFQVLLLGGYAYAHFSSRRLKPRPQAIIHLVLLLAAIALLPITPSNSWKPTGAENPTLRILALLTATLGLPYFVLSSTGPLMQEWFSRTNPGRSPYRLYALSNVGSLLALISYPFFFETHFTRRTQATMWGWTLAVFAICCGFCALRVFKAAAKPATSTGETEPELEPALTSAGGLVVPPSPPGGRPPGQERVGERRPSTQASTAEAFEGARERRNESEGLLPPPPSSKRGGGDVGRGRQGSTAPSPHQSTHPSIHPSAPSGLTRFLWLALPACASVLLLATTNKMCQDIAVMPFLWVLPLTLYLFSFIISFDSPRWYVRIPFAFGYVGALIGVYWALPKGVDSPLFLLLSVYGVAFFICCMVCHGELYRLKPDPQHLTSYYLMIAAGGALGGFLVAIVAPVIFKDYYELQWGLLFCGVFLLLAIHRDQDARGLTQWLRRAIPLLSVGLGVMGLGFWLQAHQFASEVVEKARNFYGVLTVFEDNKENPDYHHFALVHGQIRHGLQFTHPIGATWPTLYYSANSGVGLSIPALQHGPRRMGLVGLGIGTLAAYSRTNDYLRFYEINPEVVRLAHKPYFKYLANCKGKVDIVMGDARLSMEKEPSQQFDLLALDAFTGDAIPAHLLTKEAFEMYEQHMKTNGVIAVHISNHYLNLELVLDKIAKRFGYQAAVVVAEPPSPDKWWMMASTWVLLTRNSDFLNTPSIKSASRPILSSPKVPLWTDDFTSLFQILNR